MGTSTEGSPITGVEPLAVLASSASSSAAAFGQQKFLLSVLLVQFLMLKRP